MRYPWRTTGCFWEFSYTGVNECPCLICHGGPHARARNRAERHRDRATLGTALNAWRGGDGSAFDAVVPPEPPPLSAGLESTIVRPTPADAVTEREAQLLN